MPPIPLMSGRDAVKAFQKLGWEFSRQTGSHMILVRPGQTASLSVPDHKELDRGTLRGLIRTANVTVDEFLAAT